MNSSQCRTCGGDMRPLLTSLFCPACDEAAAAPPAPARNSGGVISVHNEISPGDFLVLKSDGSVQAQPLPAAGGVVYVDGVALPAGRSSRPSPAGSQADDFQAFVKYRDALLGDMTRAMGIPADQVRGH